MVGAVRADHLGARPDVDVVDRLDLFDQIARHRRLERRRPHQNVDRLGLPRQVHRRLSGGVGAADDEHVRVLARRGLGERGAVVDAATGEVVDAGSGVAPVVDAGGDDDGLCAQGRTVGEADRARGAVALQRDDVAGGDQFGAELGGLATGPLGELGARDAVGKAEVVLDARALPGLPACRRSLDEHGLQPLGRAVHRGAETSGTAADDDQVVEVLRGGGDETDPVGELGVGGVDQRLTGLGDHHRAPLGVGVGRREQAHALGLVGLEPLVGTLVAGEEFADLGAARRTSGGPRPW